MESYSLLYKCIDVLKLLPLEDFNKDPSDIDASEFVDHARDFIKAMDAARDLLSEISKIK